jgi:hypothetical protein
MDETRHCERSEAIQRTRGTGWIAFVASLLAMTMGVDVR